MLLTSVVAPALAALAAHGLTNTRYSNDVFVVTDVRIVEAPTRAQALELCQREVPGGVSVGVDWGTGVHLCQTRVKVSDATEDTDILQRIGVFSGSSCPYDMEVLFEPRPSVVVCAGYAETLDAISAGDFISDLAVTSERNYNNEGPGWTTLPYSLHTQATPPSPSNRGVFLSYRQPVLPITALELLTDVEPTQVALACGKKLGNNWRAAGEFAFLDQFSTSGKAVLCVQRDLTATRVLFDVAIIKTGSCPLGFQSKLALSGSISLCAKWASDTSAFVADLTLHRPSSELGESTHPTSTEFLPGKFVLVSTQNLNTLSAPVYLFTRTWQGPVGSTVVPVAKPPLTAKLDTTMSSLSFKILQIADLHYTGDPAYACRDVPTSLQNCTESVMTKWVNDLLDMEKPDFVAFTGDNVETFSKARHHVAMDAATSGVEARGIPYGMIFGNHDDENGFPREEIIKIAVAKPHSYTQRGPEDVDGVGNYELGVQAPVDGVWGTKGSDVFRMYFLDSHGYPDKAKYPLVSSSYDWVKPNQIAYYRQLSEAHAAANNSVPAVMFFHIPLVEYNANTASKTNGDQHEAVSSSNVNTNLFSTLVDRDEVKAAFVGHDHINDYCYKRQGIQLCYGGGAGFGQAYGSASFTRRARTIEWSVGAKGQRRIRSWKRHFDDLSTRKLEELLYSEAR